MSFMATMLAFLSFLAFLQPSLAYAVADPGRSPSLSRGGRSPSPPQGDKTFTPEQKAKLEKGAQALANAVKVTLGPKGRNVAISKSFGCPQIVCVTLQARRRGPVAARAREPS